VNRSADSAPGTAAARTGRTRAAGQSQFVRPRRDSIASNDYGTGPAPDDLAPGSDEECHFEIFRKDEERMTSTRFSGGDWRWRLVTTGGLVLAEASGYPSQTTCRAAVSMLQRRAAGAPVLAAPDDRR
jgi:uncharacterized protein YegP (UPF0339 family)